MARRKGKKAGASTSAPKSSRKQKKETPQVTVDWDEYFRRGDLSDWQRLMADLGFDEHFPSKTQCRKALDSVWVNIPDFLEDVKAGRKPYFFESESELSRYTLDNRKVYPRKFIQKGSPLSKLLANIL